MNGKKILINQTYLDLIRCALNPGEVIDVSDFHSFIANMKQRLQAHGRPLIFEQMIREEANMLAKADSLV